MTILCCGEALIDMIPNDDGAFMPHAGGAVFNTAIGLGRQKADVGLISGVSSDLFGELLAEALKASQVGIDHLITSSRPTTLAFVKLVDGKASYAFYDENTAGRLIEPSDLPTDLPADTKAMFFGGISLAVEPCADTYFELLKRSSGDKLVMVDPNIRPSFIVDEDRYRTRMDQILHHSHVIKISDEDLEWLDRSDKSIEDKAKALLVKNTALVCLTMGSEGVRAFRADDTDLHVKAPVKTVVDTVGAGDAFNAGVLTMLDRNDALSVEAVKALSIDNLTQVLTFASHFAADTVTRAGSDPAWDFELNT